MTSINDYLSSMKEITQNMLKSFEGRAEHIENLMSESNSDNAYIMEIGDKIESLGNIIENSRDKIN